MGEAHAVEAFGERQVFVHDRREHYGARVDQRIVRLICSPQGSLRLRFVYDFKCNVLLENTARVTVKVSNLWRRDICSIEVTPVNSNAQRHQRHVNSQQVKVTVSE